MGADKIEGYDEFMRDTARIEKQFPEAMKPAATEFASEWVSAAKANTNTAQETMAATMLIAISSGDGATISCDSPLFFGSEFGGQGRPETMQFPPFNGQRGYWFYPARRDNEDRFTDIWAKGVDDAMSDWDRHG